MSEKEFEKVDRECKDCELAKSNNPKFPLCNYHQGFQKGKLEAEQGFILWLDWLKHSKENTWKRQVKVKLEQLQKEVQEEKGK